MVSSISSSTSSWAMQRPDSSQMASKIFSKLDTKNQGYIEKSDLESAFSQIGSSDSTSKVDELFSQLDSDNNGKVTQSELADSLKKLAEQLDTGFNNMRMGNGAGGVPPQGKDKGLTKDELTAKAKEVSSTDSNLSSLLSTAASNFDTADTDGDGRVTAKEAMAYQQSQQASSTSSSTASSSTSSVTATGNTASSNSTSTAQTDVLMRIMQLVHAYGSHGHTDQSSSTTSSSLSAVA